MNVSISQLESLQRQRDQLLARGEIASLQREIPALERWADSMESASRLADPLVEEIGRWVGSDPFAGDPDYYGRRVSPIDQVGDRSQGQDRLIFQSEYDLARIRGFARVLTNEVAPAIAVQRNLTNYVIGTNWTYEVEPTEKSSADDSLAMAIGQFVQRWLSINRWIGNRDREIYSRTKRDGEAFVSLESVGDGMTRIRVNEPSWITEPAHPRDLDDWLHSQFPRLPDIPYSWTFGVLTPENDVNRVFGYHVVRDVTGRDWDFILSRRMVHFRATFDSNVKRGVSEYHPVHELIRNGEKVFGRASIGAIVQASIAGVKQSPPGTRESQITGISRVGSRTDSVEGGTRQIDQSKFGPATILTMSSGFQWQHGPMGTQRNPMILLAGQGALRLAGVRWNMPEWMISGDASNNNYSSSLVAESPFVKAAEAEQYAFKCGVEELLWKAIRIANNGNAFRRFNVDWQTISQAVKLTITPTPVATRDPDKEANRRVRLIGAGVMSRQTAAEEEGLDWQTEQDRMSQGIDDILVAASNAGIDMRAM